MTARDPRTGRFTTGTDTPIFAAVAGPHVDRVRALLAAESLPADAGALVAALEEARDG